MGYALVLLVAVATGAAVYVLTLRGATGHGAVGFGTEVLRGPDLGMPAPPAAPPQMVPAAGGVEAAVPPPGDGVTYLRVMTEPPSWTERLQGLLGVIVLVVFSAALLAAAVYGVGHIVNSTISHFLTPH